jgi:CSLREA domain-containing protein
MSRILRVLLALGATLGVAGAAQGATIPVTTTADGIAADGECSLREAVTASRDNAPYQGCPAGDAAGTDSILLDARDYVLSLAGSGEGANLTGDLDTGVQSLRIVGRGAGVTALDANRIDRAFDVVEGASLALADLTVRNGLTPTGDPGEEGGGVRSQGSLSVLRVAFVANVAGDGSSGAIVGGGGSGGAISSRPGNSGVPNLTVSDSSFIGNRAGNGGDYTAAGSSNGGVGGRGGALEIQAGLASISGTTFSGNSAGEGGNGGGIAPLNSGGEGGDGGAIYVAFSTMTVTTSTFASNRSGAGGLAGGDPAAPARGGGGGAIYVDSSAVAASAEYSTFSGNLRGPASFADAANGMIGVRVASSILADAAPACQNVTAGPLRNVALPGDPSCGGPRLDGDPRLGPLAANGGPTLTLAPGAGSAAIDALAGAACPAADQRGLPRPALGGCDAGAVEVQPPPAGAAAAPRTTAPAKARRLSALRLSPAAFRAARSGGSIGTLTKALQQRKPIGTTVRYTLDGAARVTFTITKPAAGRRKGGRCVKPAATRPGARRCVRTQKLKGSFVHQGVAGQNSFRFTGRLRRKALALGPYRLVAKLPRPATGRAALAGKAFRIVR